MLSSDGKRTARESPWQHSDTGEGANLKAILTWTLYAGMCGADGIHAASAG